MNENINVYLNILDIDHYLMYTNCMHVNLEYNGLFICETNEA